jgi:hypothetical protein
VHRIIFPTYDYEVTKNSLLFDQNNKMQQYEDSSFRNVKVLTLIYGTLRTLVT